MDSREGKPGGRSGCGRLPGCRTTWLDSSGIAPDLPKLQCERFSALHYLKGRSRVISLADLKAEGEFVLAVPHRILYAGGAWKPDAPPRAKTVRRRETSAADGP